MAVGVGQRHQGHHAQPRLDILVGEALGIVEHSVERAAAGRATAGPHRQDLEVTYLAKTQPAALGSTGEQKALLIGLILAHADLVAERRGAAPVLLLDEVAAHLDPSRRAALFARLGGRGQVWMTATEAALFEGIGNGVHYQVADGTVLGT